MIDYHTTDWGEAFSAGVVDVVLDTVGEEGTAEKAFSILSTHGGHLVTIADFTDVVLPSAVPAGMTFNSFINSDTNLRSAPEMEAISTLVREGALSMPSVSVYGLDQTAEAFATSAAGHVVGKLVVSVANFTATEQGRPSQRSGGGGARARARARSKAPREQRGGRAETLGLLAHVEYAAGAIITEMNATVVVPADPRSTGGPEFWYGLQTAKGNGALIQPILAWGQNGVANGWSIFHEVYDWNTGRDYRSPETLKVYAGDVLTQSVRYRPENNSYDMFISSDGASGGGGGGGGGSIKWNYQLQASQGDTPESTAYLVVEHQPRRSCAQFPASGNVTFEDVSLAVDYAPVAAPAWVAAQEKPACGSEATVLNSATAVISWNTSAAAAALADA